MARAMTCFYRRRDPTLCRRCQSRRWLRQGWKNTGRKPRTGFMRPALSLANCVCWICRARANADAFGRMERLRQRSMHARSEAILFLESEEVAGRADCQTLGQGRHLYEYDEDPRQFAGDRIASDAVGVLEESRAAISSRPEAAARPVVKSSIPGGVTVVMPLYNKGPHVERAIRSVLTQKAGFDTLLVVDDGSTDDGPDRVKAFTDPRVQLLRRSPPGPGGYAARNHAIRQSRTEWIAFLDADDAWKPDFTHAIASLVHEYGQHIGSAFTSF